MSDKPTLRRLALERRAAIVTDGGEARRAIPLFLDTIRPAPDAVIALYHPKGREFDCLPLFNELLRLGHACALPVAEDGRVMRFARWRGDAMLEAGRFDVMRPVLDDRTEWIEPDIVVVPLLAFDRTGTRLGYGGGHYDATLADLRRRKAITAVGLGFGAQLSEALLPLDDHDEKLDYAITPDAAYLFNG